MSDNTSYNYTQYTPVDSTGQGYVISKCALKNIRFALTPSATITVDQADMCNLPGIAFRTYGDTSAWRVILAFNGLRDAIQDVFPGTVLNLPSKNDLDTYVAQQNLSSVQPVSIII